MHLTGVYLTGMCLMGVYLMGVHLIGVYLTGVYLTGVYLTGVYLTGIHLDHKNEAMFGARATLMYLYFASNRFLTNSCQLSGPSRSYI